MRRHRVVARIKAGPTWQNGPPEEQPGWDEHTVYVDALVDAGTFVMGGPFSDNSGSMVLYEGITVDEARAVLARDPFVRNGVFVVEYVRDWTVYVDSLTSA